MKCFVWQFAEKITSSWHDGGGVLAIASTETRARELISIKASEESSGTPVLGEVDKSWDVPADSEEFVMLFPDAGCC